MAYHGIATALLGKETDPYFHCNIYEMDQNSRPSVTEDRLAEIKAKPWSQKYLTSEVQTNRIADMSFASSVAADDLEGTAKRFFDTVAETVKLQKADPEARNYQVPLVLGKDARQGFDVYERFYYHGKFLEHAPASLKTDIDDLVFHFGEFHSKDPKRVRTNLGSISAFSQDDLALITTYGNILQDPEIDASTRKWAVDFLSNLAYEKGKGYAKRKIKITNPHKEEPEATPFQPFSDVAKTMMLDQIAHSEDSIQRMSTRKDRAFKQYMAKQLSA